MVQRLSLVVVLIGALCTARPAPSAEPPGADQRFRPDEHFPSRTILHVSVGSFDALLENLSTSLPGRLISDPGFREAFRGLREKAQFYISLGSGPVVEVTGKTPLELLRLFRGGVTLNVSSLGLGMPDVAMAIDISPSREEVLGVLKKCREHYERSTGRPIEKRSFGKQEADAWMSPVGPLFQTVLGSHLVIASSASTLGAIVERFEGRAGGEGGLRSAPLYAGLDKRLQVANRQVFATLDLDAIRAILLDAIERDEGEEGRKEAERFIKLLGLDQLSSFGVAVGFEDGGATSIVHLGQKRDADGMLGIILRGLREVKGADEAAARIPAGSFEVGSCALAPGKIVLDVLKLVRAELPEVAEAAVGALAGLEESTGISIEKDVGSLGEMSLFTFAVEPPAGGLFGDRLALVRTAEFDPCEKLFRKVAAAIGAEYRELPLGAERKVEYVIFGSGFSFSEIIASSGPTPKSSMSLLFALAFPVVAHVDLGDGWTAVSGLPQALRRYVDVHSKGKKLADVPELAALFTKQCGGARSASVFQGDRTFLYTYNSALALAGLLAPFLAQAGIDVARLPPAEVFLADSRPGYTRLDVGLDGVTLRGHRLAAACLGSSALLVGAGILAGVTVPAILYSRAEAAEAMRAEVEAARAEAEEELRKATDEDAEKDEEDEEDEEDEGEHKARVMRPEREEESGEGDEEEEEEEGKDEAGEEREKEDEKDAAEDPDKDTEEDAPEDGEEKD